MTETEAPLYLWIAPEVARMRRLDLSYLRIAEALGVDDKTVAKAARWLEALR